HGMLTPAIIELLVTEAKFLSVNTQANAGNRGFNTLTRYPRADYVSIAGNELELEIRAREQPMSDLLLELVDQIDCPRFTITLGKDGSLHYDRVTGFIEVPALAVKIVDRVGAGDAVLAVTTPLVLKNFSWDVVGFIGNLAGAEMVGHLGNRNYLDRVNMSKHVRALLK
ncbi:MAG: PfkB family carbohydrate kinase, partial [Rhodospirillales bacterium]